MNKLYIYDQSAVSQIDKFAENCFANDAIFFLPLTSNSKVSNELKQLTERLKIRYEFLNTSLIINHNAKEAKEKYLDYIANLPNFNINKNKDIKTFFSFTAKSSYWWNSLVAEKNTWKSNTFNDWVFGYSIFQIAHQYKIEEIIFCCNKPNLKQFLYDNCKILNVRFRNFKTKIRKNFKTKLLEFNKFLFFKNIIFLLLFAIKFFIRNNKIKKETNVVVKRNEVDLGIVTYYPFISDLKIATDGVFKNKHYPYLEEALTQKNMSIAWCTLFIANDTLTIKDACKYLKDFVSNGYTFITPMNYLKFSDYFKSFFSTVYWGFKFLTIKSKIETKLLENFNIFSLTKNDWYNSFAGITLFQAMLYYRSFSRMLSITKFEKILLPTEMHSWEKALIMAKNDLNIDTKVYAYQPGTISPYLLNYFSTPVELNQATNYCYPQPDMVLCNGIINTEFMLQCGWESRKVETVEAIRYFYMQKYRDINSYKKKDLVLLALSISPEESSAFLQIVVEAFKNPGFDLLIKPHPALDISEAFEKSGLSRKDFPFKIVSGSIEPFLQEAKIVISGESGVSIEAIGLGCYVINLNNPHWINMSPLKNIVSPLIREVNTPEELSENVHQILKSGIEAIDYKKECFEILNRFFNFASIENDSPQLQKLLLQK